MLEKGSRIYFLVMAALGLLAAWAVVLTIEQAVTYSAARSQSRSFAPAVAGALREGKLDEAIKIADRYKRSHLAKVVVAGLQEYQAHHASSSDSNVRPPEIEAAERAMERAEAIVHAEMDCGNPQFATIAGVAPLAGFFGTLLLLVQALRSFSRRQADTRGLANAVARSLVLLAAGVAVAVLAYWMYQHFSAALGNFDVESRNSASELVDYFIKQSGRAVQK
jgi:biopolymer transport protein ExbB